VEKWSSGREQEKAYTPQIKVAIIDCGVDAWQQTIAKSIKFGKSYIENSPWYKADHPHGTQMASLIRQINPLVSLYVYRAATSIKDLDVSKAAKVRGFLLDRDSAKLRKY
jgi:hypothetical protein